VSGVKFETKAQLHAYKLGRSRFGAEVYEAIETMAREFRMNPHVVATLTELSKRLQTSYIGAADV